MLLSGRRIVLTGAAGGMGRAILRATRREGAAVAALDLVDDLDLAAVDGPGEVYYARCDVADRASVRAGFAEAVRRFGGIDVLVHAAGIYRMGAAEALTADDWAQVLRVNAEGTLVTNQVAFEHMRTGGGQIVNFGSIAGVTGDPGAAHYSASKGAVLAWTRAVAKEWGRHGITVNAVAPFVRTPMYESMLATLSDEQLDFHRRTLASRMAVGGDVGDADRDLAPVIVFLASEAAHYITGQTIPVDGGWLILS